VDDTRFDSLTRSLSDLRSRRGLTRLLIGIGLGGPLALGGLDENEAKRKKRKPVHGEGKKKKKKKKKTGRTPTATVPPPDSSVVSPPPPPDPCAGVVCPAVARGTSGCVGGTCIITSCDAGFRDCDGLVATGCETEVNANLQHCGTCGNVCPGQGEPNTTVTCVSGTCQQRRTNDVVISQLYTAGGASPGAAYTNDYVELFNRGTTPVTLDGWSLQYSQAAGATWTSVPLSGTLPGGRYFLVKGAGGGHTIEDLPQPNFSSPTLSMDPISGRVALVASTPALTCGAAAGCATAPGVIDFVGYGAASSAEGNAPAPSRTTVKESLFRRNAGCTDTNNNGADFTLAAAAPRTSATPASPCG
jgi:hypothetical protein